jgi:hypothetical protein
MPSKRCRNVACLQERRVFADELELSAKLTHRNIVFCHGGCVAPPDAPFPAPPSSPDFILFERAAGSLSHYISCRYDEQRPHPLWLREALDVGIGVLNALRWIHPAVTHGDLSSGNVLVKMRPNNAGISSMCVMLADWETARVRDRTPVQHGAGLGTAAFIPPSCDDAAHRAAGFSDDWIHEVRAWSSCHMLHAMQQQSALRVHDSCAFTIHLSKWTAFHLLLNRFDADDVVTAGTAHRLLTLMAAAALCRTGTCTRQA